MENAERRYQRAPARRGANVRTAVILLSIAVIFFGGVILARYTGGSTAGIAVLGLAINGFLLVAIRHNVRR